MEALDLYPEQVFGEQVDREGDRRRDGQHDAERMKGVLFFAMFVYERPRNENSVGVEGGLCPL